MSKNLRTDFEPGFEREPVSDQDEETEQKVVGPFVSAYLGCLARHLRRFASRRGATAARGVGTAPSSIAGAFSAALETAKHAMESGAEHRRARSGTGGGEPAAAGVVRVRGMARDGVPAGDDSETRAVRARAAVRAGQRVDALGRVVFIHKKAWKRRGYHGGVARGASVAVVESPRNRFSHRACIVLTLYV